MFPLAVFEEDGERFYLRGGLVSDSDRETGSITFPGNIPEGATVQIANATRDNIVEAARQCIDASVKGYPGTEPSAALCFSCGVRKVILGTRIEEESIAFKNSFPSLPFAGFYSGGEWAPLGKNLPARVHTMTFVNLVLGVK